MDTPNKEVRRKWISPDRPHVCVRQVVIFHFFYSRRGEIRQCGGFVVSLPLTERSKLECRKSIRYPVRQEEPCPPKRGFLLFRMLPFVVCTRSVLCHKLRCPQRTWNPQSSQSKDLSLSTSFEWPTSTLPVFSPFSVSNTSDTLSISPRCFVASGRRVGSNINDRGGSVARGKLCLKHDGKSLLRSSLYRASAG